MGSSYNSFHTNLGKDSTYFDATPTTTVARWEDAFAVYLRNWKENNNHTEVWSVEYKTKQNNDDGVTGSKKVPLATISNKNGVPKNSSLLEATTSTTATESNHEDQQVVNKQTMYSSNNNVEFLQCNRCIIIVNGNKSSANFSGATINSGNYSADQNRYFTTNNYGSPTFNSSGSFHGGGGGYIPTRTSYNDYYGGFYNY